MTWLRLLAGWPLVPLLLLALAVTLLRWHALAAGARGRLALRRSGRGWGRRLRRNGPYAWCEGAPA